MVLLATIGYLAYHEGKVEVTWQGFAQVLIAMSAFLVSLGWIIFCDRQMKPKKKEQDFVEGWEPYQYHINTAEGVRSRRSEYESECN